MTMAVYLAGKPIMQDYYNGGAQVNAGDVVVLGNMPCVAHEAIPSFTGGPLQDALACRGGIYGMTADQNYYPVGTYVYWDPTAQKVTGASGGQCVPFGWIVGLAGYQLSDTTASTTVAVLHDPSDDTGMVYQLGANATDTVTNTASETAFATLVTIPASTLVIGDTIHVRAVAVVTGQNSNNTNMLKLKMQTASGPTYTIILNTGAINAAVNSVAILDADIIFTAVGASGLFYATGDIAFGASGTASRSPYYVANTAVNTAEAMIIEVTDTQSAANTGNVCQLVEFLVEKRRK